MNQVEVTTLDRGLYRVFSLFEKETLAFTAQGLLELAVWIDAHKTELEQGGKYNQCSSQ